MTEDTLCPRCEMPGDHRRHSGVRWQWACPTDTEARPLTSEPLGELAVSMTEPITPDMLIRAWRMGYLAACRDPSMERIIRANLEASEREDDEEEEPLVHHPACIKYGDDSGCVACNR